MEVDRNGLEMLTRSDCLRLLEGATIGRVGLCMGALPVVLPVNFVLTERGIVISTQPGTSVSIGLDRSRSVSIRSRSGSHPVSIHPVEDPVEDEGPSRRAGARAPALTCMFVGEVFTIGTDLGCWVAVEGLIAD